MRPATQADLERFGNGDQLGIFYPESGVQVISELISWKIEDGCVTATLGRSWVMTLHGSHWLEIESGAKHEMYLDALTVNREDGDMIEMPSREEYVVMLFKPSNRAYLDPARTVTPAVLRPLKDVLMQEA